MQWRIYYTDGSTFSDADGAPENAPGSGVLVIVQRDETVGRELLHGGGFPPKEFYTWERGRWWISDAYGLFDYLMQPGLKKVVFGRSIENPIFQATLLRALNDPDFPAKNARLPNEAPVR